MKLKIDEEKFLVLFGLRFQVSGFKWIFEIYKEIGSFMEKGMFFIFCNNISSVEK